MIDPTVAQLKKQLELAEMSNRALRLQVERLRTLANNRLDKLRRERRLRMGLEYDLEKLVGEAHGG